MATQYWLMETSFVHVIVGIELPKDMTAALLKYQQYYHPMIVGHSPSRV